ncbi:unnamed protein product [Penicillium bialowiezense]
MAKPTGTSTDHIEPTTTPGKELSRELEDINSIPLGWFVWMVAFTASIAGLLFGYALPRVLLLEIAHRNLDMTQALSLQYWFTLETIWTDGHQRTARRRSLPPCVRVVRAFFGAIFAGLTADKFGRKTPIYIGCFLFTVGAALQASAYSIPQMAVGRFVVGLGVGSAAMIVPLYVAELAPAHTPAFARDILTTLKARDRYIGEQTHFFRTSVF